VASVTVFNAARSKAIEDKAIVSGLVDVNGNLILKTNDGTTQNAGVVRGPQGPKGDDAMPKSLGSNGGVGSTLRKYIRVATVNGVNAVNGSQIIFDFNGGGNFGTISKYSAKVHVGQRGDNLVQVEVFENGEISGSILWYTEQISTYVFNVWVSLPVYHGPIQLQVLSEWNGTVVYDSATTNLPSGLDDTTIRVYPQGQIYATGLLDPAYEGPGPAKVTFLPGTTLSTEAYIWVSEYKAWRNRAVTLRRENNTWVIVGHSQDPMYGGIQRITLFNNWVHYTTRNGDSALNWADARAQRLPSGIVLLSGLIGYGTGGGGVKVGQLPPECWPDTTMLFPVNNGDTPRTIKVTSIGEIVTESSATSGNTYLSLDGIAFPAKGVATWTNIGATGSGSALVNGWTAYNTSIWGQPRYWKDPYGFVWYAGLVGGGSTATDGLLMVSMPTAYNPSQQTHATVGASGDFGFTSAMPGSSGGLGWKTGTTSNTWISLCGLAVPSVTSDTLSWKPMVLFSSWAIYSGAFTQPSFLRRADGLAVTKGLMKSGTTNSRFTTMTRNMFPETTTIFLTVSAQVTARLNLRGERDTGDTTHPGMFMTGGNTVVSWVALDNIMWMTGN